MSRLLAQGISRLTRAVVVLAILGLSLASAPSRPIQAAVGVWVQTEWTTPTSALIAAPTNTTLFFRPPSAGFGVLTGTFGVCAGTGAWCRGEGDTAPGQTLRLSGNWGSDQGNPYSSDLNGDGVSELLVSNQMDSTPANGGWIFWGLGNPANPSWSAAHSTTLPTVGAYGVSVADLNGDGYPEVIWANLRNGSDYNTNSYIYWGQPGTPYGVSYSQSARTELPTSGGLIGAIADLNRDGRPEIIFANWRDNTTNTLDSYIYWGQAGGTYGVQYSPAARTGLLTFGAHGIAVADLNRDGWAELVIGNFTSGSANIYWAQPGGSYGVSYAADQQTDLPVFAADGVAVADLNNDSVPDIAATSLRFGGLPAENYVYWGQPASPSGVTYTVGARTMLAGLVSSKVTVGDVNQDGHRDVVIGNNYATTDSFKRVFWGALPLSGSASISWTLPVTPRFRGLSLNDLNQDGRLDLLTSGSSTRVYFHTGNPNAPYATTPSVELPALSSLAAYASFGPERSSNADWFGQPRPIYRTAFPTFGVLESVAMDSGRDGSAWLQVQTAAQIAVGTGITLFVAASDSLAALSDPTWVQVGAVGNGTWTRTLAGVAGRYARYRVVLWRDHTTEASPGLQSIAFTYATSPAPFGKSAPSNGAINQPTTLTLSWSPASEVDHFRFCYSTAAGCVPMTNAGTNTSIIVSDLIPGTRYYWQVRACGDPSCTVFRDADNGLHWYFQTGAPVGSFNKVSPGDSAVNVNPSTAHLVWSTAAGATDYRVCLGTSINACDLLGSGPGQYASVGITTSRALSDLSLQPNTLYYWQVLATNGVFTSFANGNSLAFWSFTTQPNRPGLFSKLSPAFNASNVPTQNVSFHWQPATGAMSYTLCIGAFPGDCTYRAAITGTHATLSSPLPAGAVLMWQVTAHNPGGDTNADNNTWWLFTTTPNTPQTFSKLSPLDGATGQPLGVVLTWQDAVAETYYRLCAGTEIGVCTLISATLEANTTFTNLASLNYGTQYWWQVSACNAGGCTPANNGAFWGFKTLNPPSPGPFQKRLPVNGASALPANPNQILLSWSASQEADGYELCFGTVPGACDLSGGGFQDVGNRNELLISQLPFSVSLQLGQAYWWQVRAYSNVTATRTFADGGVDFYFTTKSGSSPGPFSKDAPVNNTFNVPTDSVTLRWFPSADAARYEVCVGTTVNQCNAMPENTWRVVGKVLTTSVDNLSPGTTYFWQVRALNEHGQTQANDGVWWTFVTRNASPPAPFNKIAPTHQAVRVSSESLTLSWGASVGATGYEVCIGSAPGLCEVSAGWLYVGNVTSHTLASLHPGRTYWWQVRALGNSFSVQADNGQWWAFTTENSANGPGSFQKIAPADGSVISSAVSLSWTSSLGASFYLVCVGSEWGLCDGVNNAVTDATSYTVAGLQPGAYWWQIIAVNDQGLTTQADNGARWTFIVRSTDAIDNPETRMEAAPLVVRMSERVSYTLVLSNPTSTPMTVRVTDTLATSATLVGATPGYVHSGQLVVWESLAVPSFASTVLTLTVQTAPGSLAEGYLLSNVARVGTSTGEIIRHAPYVRVMPHQVYLPVAYRPN